MFSYKPPIRAEQYILEVRKVQEFSAKNKQRHGNKKRGSSPRRSVHQEGIVHSMARKKLLPQSVMLACTRGPSFLYSMMPSSDIHVKKEKSKKEK